MVASEHLCVTMNVLLVDAGCLVFTNTSEHWRAPGPTNTETVTSDGRARNWPRCYK